MHYSKPVIRESMVRLGGRYALHVARSAGLLCNTAFLLARLVVAGRAFRIIVLIVGHQSAMRIMTGNAGDPAVVKRETWAAGDSVRRKAGGVDAPESHHHDRLP